MKKIFTFLLLNSTFFANAQDVGSFKDERDGNLYNFVSYTVNLSDGSKSNITWMSENLKYNIGKSRCYDNSEANCDKYGRQYMHFEAMKACPRGWHLPSDNEWTQLVNLYDGISLAGLHLKNKSELWGEGLGTNKSRFNAFPDPPRNQKNRPKGMPSSNLKEAIFWSSSEKNAEYAWDWKVVSKWNSVQRWEGSKKGYNSVRCVKN